MTTSAPDRLATESYNNLMPLETRPFKMIDAFPVTITIDEDRILNIVSIDLAKQEPSAEYAERQLVYTPEE